MKDIIIILLLTLLFSGFIYNLILHLRDKTFIQNVLFSIIHSKKIQSKEHLILIKNFLQNTIQYDGDKKDNKRPFLRATARNTIINKYGFCGENARLAFNLMFYGGIKSNRVYLYGKKWKHVILELKWKNNYFLVDGHNDIELFMKDSDILQIPSDRIDLLTNSDPENPWIDSCRIKLFYNCIVFKKWKNLRLPQHVLIMLESPHLLKSYLFLFLLLISIFIILIN